MADDNYIMLKNWSEIVLKLWRRKIQDMEVWHSGDLFYSLASHVIANANGDVSRIEFFFKYYGIFPDMGVGRGGPDARKKKQWYSKVFHGNMKDLVRIVAERYGEEASKKIAVAIRNK